MPLQNLVAQVVWHQGLHHWGWGRIIIHLNFMNKLRWLSRLVGFMLAMAILNGFAHYHSVKLLLHCYRTGLVSDCILSCLKLFIQQYCLFVNAMIVYE